MIYLNQAGTSWPKPRPVQEAVHTAMAASPGDWERLLETHHRRVCAAFGVSDPEHLRLTPGATSALALAIADVPWERGDRVLISAMEHHALHGPVQRLRARGVEVTVIPRARAQATVPGNTAPRPDTGPCDLDALTQELERGRVRLVAMTMASNVTGECLPVHEIIDHAHAHEALVLLDAAQVAGWLPLDFPALGADLVVFTAHKGLQAPWGIGGLYMAPRVEMNCPGAVCNLPKNTPPTTRPGFCDTGSIDRFALAGLAAALDWLAQPERRDHLQRARRQIETLRQVVQHSRHSRLLGSAATAAKDSSQTEADQAQLPTLAFEHLHYDSMTLVAALRERGIIAAGGLQCAPLAHESLGTQVGGAVRLSAGPSNDDDEIDRAAGILQSVVQP